MKYICSVCMRIYERIWNANKVNIPPKRCGVCYNTDLLIVKTEHLNGYKGEMILTFEPKNQRISRKKKKKMDAADWICSILAGVLIILLFWYYLTHIIYLDNTASNIFVKIVSGFVIIVITGSYLDSIKDLKKNEKG